MANDVMALDERIGRLEETVAKGFFDLNGRVGGVEGRMERLEGRMERLEGRMERLEGRMDAMNNKLDVTAEALEGKIQTVLEHLDAFSSEMRRTTRDIVQEHRADRRLMYEVLRDHGVRIHELESARSGPGSSPA